MAHRRRGKHRKKQARYRARTADRARLYIHDKTVCDCLRESVRIRVGPGRFMQQELHFDDRHALVWFALIYRTDVNGRGVELYSVDTSHGYLHEHVTGHRRRKDYRDLYPLYSHVDVQEAFDYAQDLIDMAHRKSAGKEVL